MDSKNVQLVLDAKATLGEGPSWNEEEKALYWVDIIGEKFCRFDPETGQNESFPIGEFVGAVVCAGKDEVVLATQSGFQSYHMKQRTLTPLVDPEDHLPSNRFNDGKCDSHGRFWAGTMEIIEKGATGSLYVLEPDGSCRKVHEDVGVSNGIAWSQDEKEMYYIDSMRKHVLAFDFDAEKGEISRPRTLIDFADEQGFPDGMTIDAEGMLWIAHWDGWQVSRWNPRTGMKLESIAVPAAKVTSCIFGGDELDTLYITSARKGLEDDNAGDQPHAGGIFTVKPGVKGTKTHAFGTSYIQQKE
ncbi:SMP-30/gluconolactonase/LRE family protein [Paenibacillus sp. CGMCC 1.16610]|uniref:Regucalcin n=1 Tax=Paenibacillus anseongense TaxID=2682845 RepID=A0ABW9UDT6_9BACL|nr:MULTISPECIES: SMP-30/gluconolactonase/LRE family protein [Paenibacillus]MBA2938380.1 SMP-30/gluconolactonase/LRE family protein [Paenibacillus sp. CGMCC 1.16610]MVQ37439.1 SMP-30/gluconolactonase/LRE family protein [Paenibacillus anseongense]